MVWNAALETNNLKTRQNMHLEIDLESVQAPWKES